MTHDAILKAKLASPGCFKDNAYGNDCARLKVVFLNVASLNKRKREMFQ